MLDPYANFRRITRMPVGAVKTYRVHTPPDVTIVAACHEVGCPHWRDGWDTIVDERTDLGQTQAAYIRQQSGRTFTEMTTGDGRTVFRFEAHQRCFAEHRTRPETYRVLAGDWRSYRGLLRDHLRPADWVEDFADHQQRLADQIARG